MSALERLAGAFAQVDTLLFLVLAVVVGLMAFHRKRRPFSMSRAMDVALSTILFIMLGVRYAVLAVLTLAFPAAVMAGAGPALPPFVAALQAAVAAIGFGTHRAGSVPARALGALTLAAMTLLDTFIAAFVLDQTPLAWFDTVLALAVAAGACVCAAFFWTYRTAIPNPLGSDRRPFDY